MTLKSLDQWLDFISRTHPSEIEMGLERIKSVFGRMPLYSSSAKIVLVAGTNGKGSTIAMVEAGLSALGFRVGAYTSPHITSYNERVRIGSTCVSDSALCQAFEKVEHARQSVPLTYFEYGTLAALDILLSADLDVVLLEIGLGGRLDAVNIVNPDMSIITSIGLDHMDWLGDTVEKIGREKAGILRQNGLFIGGESLPDSVHDLSKALMCQDIICREDFDVVRSKDSNDLKLKQSTSTLYLKGFPSISLPENNLLISLQAILSLYEQLAPEVTFSQASYELVTQALEGLSLPGRLELVIDTQQHQVFLDVGHNPHAANYLKNFLSTFAENNVFIQIVYSSLADKDAFGVLQALRPVVDHCLLTQLECDRAMSLDALTLLASQSGYQSIETYTDINEAFEKALDYPKTLGSETKVVTLILGSFFMVEAAKRFLKTYD